ncbi:MAG TPA: hypothetical protein VFZ65_03290 [Planctomycetota bacterium]|nr:hypothetical protein [Planctomycetota bacterium]
MRPWFALVLLAACASAQYPPSLVLPPRAATALTGSQLLPHLQGLSLTDREIVLWHEFAAGNVPSFLRTLVPVATQAVIQGQLRTATFWCTPDYVGVGTDADWFRMPMTPTLGQQLADRLECTLPTRRMVDACWAQAALQLAPFPYSPSVYDILSVDLFYQHHLHIETQRAGQPQNLLTAGIKKDVVASALIASWPGRVCIYGWHYQNGTPIQPLSKVHTFAHVDYSHGLRLVARRMEVDGVRTTVDAVLADPVLHPLLSDEGPFTSWRYPAGTAESFPMRDTFPATGPQLQSWLPKFTTPVSVAASPPPPSGDATVLRVMDPAGGTESLRLVPGLARDLGWQATLLCEHRPQLAADGFERIGIFVRDQAAGAFDGTLSQQGACYALTWDSHDGRVRCLRVQGGTSTDLLPAPLFVPGTAWRRFCIDAVGSELTFTLDGERLLQTNDTTYASGDFGIGFHEFFTTNTNMRGTRVDSCDADVPGAFALMLQPGLSPGELHVRRERGVPGDVYFTALTVLPGAFPNGWFYGLDPTLDDVVGFFLSGHPLFVGPLDGEGRHDFAFAGLPLGLPLQGVGLDLDPSLRRLQASAPVQVTVR